MEQPQLETTIGKLRLRSPLLTASGTSGSADELAGLSAGKATAAALGAFVTKGVTLAPRQGNPEPRIIETRAGILNSIGLQNKGADRFLSEDLPKLRYALRRGETPRPTTARGRAGHPSPPQSGVPIIVNISANTVEEYGQLAERILEGAPDVAGLEINVSCPNIKHGGVSFGIDPRAIEKIVRAVKKKAGKVTIITKLTPNITDITVPAKAAIAAGTDALSMINTLRGVAIDIRARKPYFANVAAGLSGPAVKPVGLCMVWDCFAKIPECHSQKVPIIGIGGISTWQDAVEYLLAGASAVQVGTAWFVYPDVFTEMHKGLTKYLERGKLTVTQLVGAAHR
jgi:dihydroorotate dehydrogenase (NAD+) catalytic subunit